MSSRITIKDVAKEAGVSIATVSNVMNGTGRVSIRTVRKVEDVIERLQFYPSKAARNLKDKSSHLIAVVVPYLKEARLRDNPFYWKLMIGIEEGAKHKSFQVMLMDVNDEESFAFVQERHLDGLIVVGTFQNAPVIDRILALKKPVVFMDSYISDLSLYQVYLDDEEGGYLGAKHLLELGHRSIGVMCGLLIEGGVYHARWKGFQKAIREAGLSMDNQHIFDIHTSAEKGRRLAHQIAEEHPDITAMFSFSDIGALGLIRGFHEKGIRVPDDMSVMGFDDMYYMEYMNPALTTIRQNVHEKGRAAVEMLMELIDDSATSARQIVLPVELIVRESTDICKHTAQS
ncbi:LacI family DNA-binding transcriptional regulator [Marinicrinis sediminis]|uniref:LacI family DNA-binding transcriptional regulator n=1 Tax=Marinicrinis sediminis TaxID=1652465 RepID=A0ABW5RA85_9BACL